jgi:hypothetical protein
MTLLRVAAYCRSALRLLATVVAGGLAIILPVAPGLRAGGSLAVDHLLKTSPYSVGDVDDQSAYLQKVQLPPPTPEQAAVG